MLSEVELVLERISVKFEVMAYVKKTISNILKLRYDYS